MDLSNKVTSDKIVRVRVEQFKVNASGEGRLFYKTEGDGKPNDWWTGYIEVNSINLLVEHLMTVARSEGKATTERKLVDRVFKGAALGLYIIGEFQVQVII